MSKIPLAPVLLKRPGANKVSVRFWDLLNLQQSECLAVSVSLNKRIRNTREKEAWLWFLIKRFTISCPPPVKVTAVVLFC